MLGRDWAERLGDIAAFTPIETAGGSGPANGVGDDLLDGGMVIDRKSLVAGAEIDDLAFAAAPGAAAGAASGKVSAKEDAARVAETAKAAAEKEKQDADAAKAAAKLGEVEKQLDYPGQKEPE